MKEFTLDMTVQDCIDAHPRAREVLAGMHLGGCAHCHIAEFETLDQIADGYGVPKDMLIDTLNSLWDLDEKKK